VHRRDRCFIVVLTGGEDLTVSAVRDVHHEVEVLDLWLRLRSDVWPFQSVWTFICDFALCDYAALLKLRGSGCPASRWEELFQTNFLVFLRPLGFDFQVDIQTFVVYRPCVVVVTYRFRFVLVCFVYETRLRDLGHRIICHIYLFDTLRRHGHTEAWLIKTLFLDELLFLLVVVFRLNYLWFVTVNSVRWFTLKWGLLLFRWKSWGDALTFTIVPYVTLGQFSRCFFC
jgi:hypothetical protein